MDSHYWLFKPSSNNRILKSVSVGYYFVCERGDLSVIFLLLLFVVCSLKWPMMMYFVRCVSLWPFSSCSRITRFHVTPSHIAFKKISWGMVVCAMTNTIRRLHNLWYFFRGQDESNGPNRFPSHLKAYLLFPISLSPITQTKIVCSTASSIPIPIYIRVRYSNSIFVDAIQVNSNGFLFCRTILLRWRKRLFSKSQNAGIEFRMKPERENRK